MAKLTTSANSWRLHDDRVWIHTTREITRKFCPILDEDGQPQENENGEVLTKQVLGVKERETAMGNCLVCYHAGPVGLKCVTCHKPFLIDRSSSRDNFLEMSHFWKDRECVNPYDLVRCANSDLHHDWCVHNGKDNPLCADIQDADGWWCSMEDIKRKRNKKYETTLSGVAFIKDMIAWNKEIGISKVQDAFDVRIVAVPS